MARKKVGKMGTAGWVAVGLGGAALLYAITRPKTTTTLPPGYYYPPVNTSGSNTTATIINDGTSVLNNLLHLFD